MAIGVGGSATASAGSNTHVSTAQPSGFDALLEPQEAMADVYVGDLLVGQARVRYRPGKVTLLNADAVTAMIPDLVEPALVRAALAAPDLDSHPEMLCSREADAPPCPTLRPAVAGVIFDDRRFRLDVLVNPRFRQVHPAAAREYLPKSTSRLSLVDQIGGSIAGAGSSAYFGIQNRAILSTGEARLRNELFYSSRFGLTVDTLVAEIDRPGLRYSAGAMWVPGIDLIGRRHLVGGGVQSQIDTRLDRTVIVGTPLVVALATRARVDILREGRLMTSRVYEAGNQTLDTATLPDGTYEVMLHIQEAGGAARDEKRFFTKNAALPASGETYFFAYAGLLGEERRKAPLATTGQPFYQAGMARRLSARFAIDATLVGTDGTALVEVGGSWFSPLAQMRLAGLASVHGDAGLFLQASSSGTSRWNFNLDARRIWSRNDEPLIPIGDSASRGYDIVTVDRSAQLSAGSFGQVSGTISYALPWGQIGLTGSYRHDPRSRATHAIGASAYWPVLERDGMRINLRGDVTVSNHGTTGLLGLSLQRTRARSTLIASAGMRSTSGTGADSGTDVVGSVGAVWQREGFLGGDASFAASAEREVGGTLVRGRGEINTALASLYADIAQPVAGSNGSTQYSMTFQSTAAATAGSLAFRGRDHQDSAILVDVRGAADGSSFEVLVDNTPRGSVRAGSVISVPVTAYREYSVRLRPLGGAIMHMDGGVRKVAVYPGNVSRLTWSARRVVAMFGRLVWPNGTPVADAAVYASGAIGATDASGWFQIEAATNAVLKVQAASGATCDVRVRVDDSAQDFAGLGTLVCSPALPQVRIAAASK